MKVPALIVRNGPPSRRRPPREDAGARPAVALRILLLFAAWLPLAAHALADEQPNPYNTPLPPGCLLMIELGNPSALCDRVGDFLAASGGEVTGAALRERLGDLMGNPAWAGVAPSRPARAFLVESQEGKLSWVLQFEVTDLPLLLRTLSQESGTRNNGQDWILPPQAGITGPEGAVLHVSESACTLRGDTVDIAPILEWQKRAGGAEAAKPGKVAARARAAVGRLLTLFEPRFAAESERMKTRMREALGRAGRVDEKELAGIQRSFDLAARALRQVREADARIEMDERSTAVTVEVTPLPDSLLARVAAAFSGLPAVGVRGCPGNAMLMLATDISLEAVARQLAADAAGPLLDLIRPAAERPAPETLFALLATGSAEAPFAALFIEPSSAAARRGGRWERYFGAGAEQLPFRLVAETGAPGQPGATCVARVGLNRESLGETAERLARRALGTDFKAALRSTQGYDAIVFCRRPDVRMLHVARLLSGADVEGALAGNESFRETMLGFSKKSNFLAYVSPEGIAAWLRLAGFHPAQAGTAGLALSAGAEAGHFHAEMQVPTGQVRRVMAEAQAAPGKRQPAGEP